MLKWCQNVVWAPWRLQTYPTYSFMDSVNLNVYNECVCVSQGIALWIRVTRIDHDSRHLKHGFCIRRNKRAIRDVANVIAYNVNNNDLLLTLIHAFHTEWNSNIPFTPWASTSVKICILIIFVNDPTLNILQKFTFRFIHFTQLRVTFVPNLRISVSWRKEIFSEISIKCEHLTLGTMVTSLFNASPWSCSKKNPFT